MKKTKFYNIHEKLGSKLVEFAGFHMPIQYSSIIAEHKAVRESVGIFDVSHMGEIFVRGDRALSLVQHITINDASLLDAGRVQYSAMCYENAGIVDDLLVYKISDTEYMLVVNGANKDKDFEWIKKNNIFESEIVDESDDYSLLAVQGPNSKKVIEELFGTSVELEYYHFLKTKLLGTEFIISRTGYTGELGYELYFKGNEELAAKVWNSLFEAGKKYNISPAGLACRDSLRLEMGFCLYGNDIDSLTTPLEAGLGWITKLKKGEFIGRNILLDQKENGISKKLVALEFEDKIFPRKGYEIFSNGNVIGVITSGTVSPMLEKPIALGYVSSEFSKLGGMVSVVLRGKVANAKVVKLPFIGK